MRIKARNSDDEPDLNLTPMIDVVFQLLIFFMVATTFLDPEKEIGIELPEASAGETPETEREELVINVFADGRIVLSGQELPAAELLGALKSAAQTDPQIPVTIRGDKLVHHEHIVRVMDACAQAGLLELAVGTMEGS
ncbi:MAG: biopolymer transport protein ExbD [Pseudohongiellaceae bacterium]